MKKLFWIIILILISAGVYYTGVYTYFLKKEVNEDLPPMMSKPEAAMLAEGFFGEIDLIHKGSGRALLLKSGEKTILRFEDFAVTNGPDLYVYLAKGEQPTGDLKSLQDYLDLGRLKGNMGNQNYEIAGSADGYNTVVIWCKKFGVLFTYAVME